MKIITLKKMSFGMVSVVCLLGMLACDDSLDSTGGEDGGSGGTDQDSEEACEVGDLSQVCATGPMSAVTLRDEQNYAFSSSLDISSMVVRGGSPIVDLTIDWSGVTRDFMGHEVNPLTDIDMVIITVWQLSQAEIIDMMNRDALDLKKLWGAIMTYPNDSFTQENLLDFTLYGNPITAPDDVRLRDSYFNAADPDYNPALHTHMVIAQTGDQQPGKNVRMLQFFTLDTNAAETRIDVTKDSAALSYTADLRSLERIPVAQGTPAISINWEYLTLNAAGREFIPTLVSRVVVAHYDMTVCEIEDRFLDLETIHDQWYFADLGVVATEIDLSTLATVDGAPFPGITADGTWIVGLFCTNECSNPAPLFLTVLHPCS